MITNKEIETFCNDIIGKIFYWNFIGLPIMNFKIAKTKKELNQVIISDDSGNNNFHINLDSVKTLSLYSSDSYNDGTSKMIFAIDVLEECKELVGKELKQFDCVTNSQQVLGKITNVVLGKNAIIFELDNKKEMFFTMEEACLLAMENDIEHCSPEGFFTYWTYD